MSKRVSLVNRLWFLKKLLVYILSLAPTSLLTLSERLLALAQGKGYGTSTVDLEVRRIKNISNELELPAELLIFDIGANIGNWSHASQRAFPASEIYAFEPSLATYKELTTRFELSEAIKTFQLGFSSKSGSATLWSDKPLSGLSGLSRRNLSHFGIEMNNCEEIRLSTIDEFCKTHSVSPHILKIDIEGHELAALKGATETLRTTRIIQFEFGGANLDSHSNFQELFSLLTDYGYEMYRITPSRLIRIKEYSEMDEYYLTTNYIAVNF